MSNIMKNEVYQTIRTERNGGVATIFINNPPVNVLGAKLMKELKTVLQEYAEDDSVKVIVFESDNSEFFIAHVDINILDDQEAVEELTKDVYEGLNIFQTIGEIIRKQPQVTIVKLKGIARAGGAEFVAAADMSFASLETGKIGQTEALMGIIPGGGATQYLSEKMPRNRVLEVILGAELFDAKDAERYGWINRSVPDSEIDLFVDKLAQQIASLPDGVVATVKKVLPPANLQQGYQKENDGWLELVSKPKAAEIFSSIMKKGAQTPDVELGIETLLRSL
jgi:enoyl-CoA hydratase/carnithine racemase